VSPGREFEAVIHVSQIPQELLQRDLGVVAEGSIGTAKEPNGDESFLQLGDGCAGHGELRLPAPSALCIVVA
jgi:hypothetical protein